MISVVSIFVKVINASVSILSFKSICGQYDLVRLWPLEIKHFKSTFNVNEFIPVLSVIGIKKIKYSLPEQILHYA